MALNWVMLDESKRPLPLPNERTVMTVDEGAEIVLEFSDATGNMKKLKAIGRIWITELRFIFVTTANSVVPSFESISVPLLSLLSTSFVQPTFSANYLVIDVKPSPGGGLTDGTKAEIRLKDRPMIAFVTTLDKMRERALYMKRESAMGDDLPVYSSRSESVSAGPSTQRTVTPLQHPSRTAAQPADAPPGYDTL